MATLLASSAFAAEPSLSVCDVARMGERLDGKVIRITGVWRVNYPGEDQFEKIVDDHCPEIEIRVVATEASLPHPPPPKGYKLDRSSALRAERVARKALDNGHDLFATIVGFLYMQREEDYVPARPLRNGVIVPPRHKWYPFVLLIQTIPKVKERVP